MKNINALIKACLYKEGAIILLIAGIVFYFVTLMAVSYGSINDAVRVFMGLGICSVPAILVVMLTTSVRILETRKTISLFPNVRVLLLQIAFSLCVFGALFVLPFFYLVGLSGFNAVVAVAVLFFGIYSLIFIFGILLAKYITPALSFTIVLFVIPIGLFLLKAANTYFHLISTAVTGLVLAWLFFAFYWFNKKQEILLDDGLNWILRLRGWVAKLMHFPQFSTLDGTFLLNNGDSIQSMVKRSAIILAISSVLLLLPYALLVKANDLSASKILFLFYAVQLGYIEFGKGNKIVKSIWLLSGGDRMHAFKRRAELHMKLAALHYGLFIFIMVLVQILIPVTGIAENISTLILITYYLIMHFAFTCVPAAVSNITIFPFIYLPLAFGNKIFELDVGGGFSLVNDPFAIFFVFAYPPLVIFIAILAKGNLKKYDFSQRSKMAGFLAVKDL